MKKFMQKHPVMIYALTTVLVVVLSVILDEPIKLVDWLTLGLVAGIHWKIFYPNDPDSQDKDDAQ